MTLKTNLVASLASQIYVSLVGVAILPFYINYMGAEAYGLVGFFAMLQVWFNLLDLGLTPTVSRETARFRGQAIDALNYRRLFRALSNLFFLVAFLGGAILFLISEHIASNWLKVQSLSLKEVQFAVQNMAICAALRWMSGLYRGVITGFEQLVWLSTFTIVITTLRFVMVLPVMWYFGATPGIFFTYQTFVACLEFLIFGLKTRSLLPGVHTPAIGWSVKPVKNVLKFSLTLAFTSAVWIFTTQIDKLVLSKILLLNDYGYFTLGVLVASSIILLTAPVGTILMPRLAKLEAEGDYRGVIHIYRQTSRLVAILAGSVAVTLALCARPLLWAWTGDSQLVEKAAPILTLYAIGNGIFTLAAFPYYLQYAKGDLRLHFLGHLLLLLFFIPLIICLTANYGAIGAGYAWLLINSAYFIVWVALIHKRFEPGLHNKWLFTDILGAVVILAVISFVYWLIRAPISSRILSLGSVLSFGLVALGLSSLTIPSVLTSLKKKLGRGELLNAN
nr:oligosaccharide flippase family protein [Legionella sp. PL877]